jgi:hypothetical protein
MACPDFAELIEQGPGGHAATCEACAARLEALAEVDACLAAAFGRISAPPELAAAARLRIAAEEARRKPTFWPEVLDFVGWAAILALLAVLTPRVLPLLSAVLGAV